MSNFERKPVNPFKVALIFAPFWLIIVPTALAIAVVSFPFRLYKRLTGQLRESPMKVAVHGPAEAAAKDTLLFIHGWPDSGALWAKQVPFFVEHGYRCIVVTLPNHDGVGQGWGADFDALWPQLEAVVREHAPVSKRVTLYLHDWGCTLGYLLAHHRPELVKRIVCLDVGAHITLDAGMALFIVAYQWYNIVAFLLGGPAGHFMNYCFLKPSYSARPLSETTGALNYLYFYLWRRMLLGRPLPTYKPDLTACPIWFGFATKKLGAFHSAKWLANLRAAPTCHIEAFACDHWIPSQKPDQLNTATLAWLEAPAPKP